MSDSQEMTQIEMILAKDAISDLMKRWCRSIDRLDFDGIRAVFHTDAFDDHGSFKGGVEALVDWIRTRHKNIPFSMHAITNCLIEFESPHVAIAETYCIGMQKYPPEARAALEGLVGKLNFADDIPLDTTIACRYVDRVTRRADLWKIERRTVVFDSASIVPGVAIPDLEAAGWVCGRRGGSGDGRDFIYQQSKG